MIVRMKKLTILVSNRHIDDSLKSLRKAGLLHIREIHQPQAEGISSLEQRLEEINRALPLMENISPQKNLEKGDYRSIVKEIISLNKERGELKEKENKLKEKLAWFKDWGNIHQPLLEELKKERVFIKLYVVPKSDLESLPRDKIIHRLKEKKGQVYFALISRQEESLPFREIEVPQKDLISLKRRLSLVSHRLEEINSRLKELAQYKNCLLDYQKELIKRLEFFKVKFAMGKEEAFSYLQGFCPRSATSHLKNLANKQGWAILIEEPDNPEEVPTLLKNPRWVEIIRPVFKFMGTLPGYKEYDISFWFLLFFSIFFAMLIGDAGYGIIFLLLTFWGRKKIKKVPPEGFLLMYVLSISTIIWGAITGTWFGMERIAKISLLNYLVIERINSFIADNHNFMMYLCFFIGAVHLTIAHGITAFRFINSLTSLSQIGWIGILWGVFFIANSLVLGKPIPPITKTLLFSGISLVVLFSHPQKNIFKAILVSLGDLPLKVIGAFSDIISYLRLFAVGYASVAVATAFNDMALGSGAHTAIGGFIAALILFLGHSLNIILGLMAVIVHGIRLNMLEFSGHLNMQWSGKEYKPFRE